MAKAFVILKGFGESGISPTQVRVQYQMAVGDGVSAAKVGDCGFVFDASLTAAQNLAALKASVVAAAAGEGITLVATDVTVFTAIN